jgi:putative ABC transport system ATP-binding protein
MNDAVLELVDVVKTFGRGSSEVRALGGVNLTVTPGEFVALMGPSGCGKSTLLHLAGGLEDPSSGRVRVLGSDLGDMGIADRAALRRTRVGYVFQRLNLLPSLTALENVALPLELEGVRAREARQRSIAALAEVGLTEQLQRFPDDFSGGQQQRIAIARAIVAERALILADEPTGALDTITSDGVIELLGSLASRFGTAVVLVTHEPRFASWAERVVFMRDGAIVDQTASAVGAPA